MRLGEPIQGLDGKFEAKRDDFKLVGLIVGLEERFEVCRADLKFGKLNFGLIWGYVGHW